jgi:hypothetical protein
MNDVVAGIGGPAAITTILVAVFLALGYFAILIDRRRDGSPSQADTQVGIKLVLYALAIVGVLALVAGLESLFAFVLGGFKPIDKLKDAAASLVSGGFIALGVLALALPRTNARAMPQVERFAWGVIALYTGLSTTGALHAVVRGVFMGEPWANIAGGLAQLFAFGVVAVLAIARLGRLSSWGVAAPPAYGQPQGGGYGQTGGYGQQGGYGQPQGGGYGQPGGYGNPPQGGGYPR